MKNVVITHLWVSGFGWENTIYSVEDFDKIKHNHVIDDTYIKFTGILGNKEYELKGYYSNY